ncbi:39S ribosomal protein L50, mitochondrial [Varanus komodoensis]|uniref:Large ribosomal subunit protein mL50 n=1 Tax=Varanus komodoensis TaxID=61221 RepID=A0A8D2L1H3_VARKO|nr:39S ribosomal protein L50, mitochondrial [Varanus komodoensis]KAF7237540.1 39S ribosomal protein L50, mitochondrial [Varanus komodoensis]
MAASMGLLRVWRHRMGLGLPVRRTLWGWPRKKEDDPETVQPAVPMKEEPVLVCPPFRSKKYIPPEDLQSRLESHVREIFGSSASSDWQMVSLGDSSLKYRLLAQLAADLGHAVPNSQLHQMKSTKDVLAFYSIPVKDISKFDELSTQELPSNLRIRWQY